MQTVLSLGAVFSSPEGQFECQGRLCVSEHRVLFQNMSLILSAMSGLSLFVTLQLKYLILLHCVSETQGVWVPLTGRYEVPVSITS